MNKLGLFGIIVAGTVVGNGVCYVANRCYKKCIRSAILREQRKYGDIAAIDMLGDHTVEELLDQYGKLL